MEKKEILELKNRKIIYSYISKYPGIHLNELLRNLSISSGTIRYHLKYLIKNGLISEENKDGYTRFYKMDEIGIKNKKILSIIRKKTPRDIILFILFKTAASQIEISKELEKNPSCITYHLKILKEKGIIRTTKVNNNLISTSYRYSKYLKRKIIGREIVYVLDDPYLMHDILVLYKSKFFDNGSTHDILNLYEYTFPKKKKKVLDGFESNLERTINTITEMFPTPICA